MKKCRMGVRGGKLLAYGSFCFLSLSLITNAFCQDGTAGINEANTKVRSSHIFLPGQYPSRN
jgi:hypothetical protein